MFWGKFQVGQDKIPSAASSSGKNERGNVFFALFGAVAIVGVLGAGIMATMRGPLSTMVEVNRREQAKAEMRVAANLILASVGADECGDADGYTEAPPMDTAGTHKPSGGGVIPGSIGATKTDPWGNPYGYCVWNHGPDPAGQTGCAGTLNGHTSANNIAIAVISSGADGVFQTSCHNHGDGDDYLRPDMGGGDDIAEPMTYNQAIASTGGLWTAVGTTGASIDRDITVTGVGTSTFTGAVEVGSSVRAATSVITDAIVPIDPLSQDYVDFAGGVKLSDVSVSGCVGPGDVGMLRIHSGGLQICQGVAGWQPVGGKWKEGAAGEIYYDTANVGVGTVTNPARALDVGGTFGATGPAVLGNSLSVGDTLTVTGVGTFNNSLGVAGDFTVNTNQFSVNATNGNVNAAGLINTDTYYQIDNNTVLRSDTLMSRSIMLGHNAGIGTTGDYNTILGAGAAGTLSGGEGNIVIGAGSSTLSQPDVPGAATDHYLNIGNLLHGDLVNKRLGIGFGDGYDASNFNDALEVKGNTDIDGDLAVSGTSVFGTTVTISDSGNIIASGNIEAADYTWNGMDFTPGSCDKDTQKLRWDTTNGWECVPDTAGGSGPGGGIVFTDLGDVPGSYGAGSAGKVVVVNSSGDGLEFVDQTHLDDAGKWEDTLVGETDDIRRNKPDGDVLIGAVSSAAAGVDGNGSSDLYVEGLIRTNSRVYAPDGAAVTPSYVFAGSPATGMYSGGADILSFATAGAGRVHILADGDVGIGTSVVPVGAGGSGQDLLMVADGPFGATHFCDENGENCFTASDFGSAGAQTFTDLTDVPGTYAGSRHKFVRVNSSMDGLEFVDQVIETVTGEPAPPGLGVVDLVDVDLTGVADGNVLVYNAGVWVAGSGGSDLWTDLGGGRIHFGADGTQQVGIGLDNPLVALDVNGTLRIGDGNEDCGALSLAGGLRYKTGVGIEYCDGTSWKTVAASGSGIILTISPAAKTDMDVDGSGCGVPPCLGAVSSFIVTNLGDTVSDVLSYTLTNTANFTVVGNTCSGNTLAQNASCQIDIQPRTSGDGLYSSQLEIPHHNAPKALLQGNGHSFGCFPGQVGWGGIVVACDHFGAGQHLITTPGNCTGATNEPTCNGGTDTLMRQWALANDDYGPIVRSMTDGAQNTVNLLNYARPNGSLPAAEHCANLVYQGHDDWYLPSRVELQAISNNYLAVGGVALASYYRSSSEVSNLTTYGILLQTGVSDGAFGKTGPIRIRCTRTEGRALPAAQADLTPGAIIFATKFAASAGAAVASDTATITSITPNTPISVGGAAGAEYSVNGAAFTSAAGTVKWGDTVAVRVTSPAPGGRVQADLTIGDSTFNYFVITRGDCGGSCAGVDKRVFVTSTTYQGNLGGVAGADDKCQAQANAAALGGTWRAILSQPGQANWAINRIDYNWNRLVSMNGQVVAASPDDLWDGTISNPINRDENNAVQTGYVWSGSTSSGVSLVEDSHMMNCSLWTSIDGFFNTVKLGIVGGIDSSWMQTAIETSCSTSRRLYCMEVSAPTITLASTPASGANMNVIGPGNPATGTPVVFTIQNTGTGGSGTLSAALGNSTNFQITNDQCGGNTLAPSATCTVEVTPRAYADGNYYGTLNVTDTVNSVSVGIGLSGVASGFGEAVALWLKGIDPGDIHYPGGFVGIGTNDPEKALDVIGDIQYTGMLFDASDIRLKEEIVPLSKQGSMLEKLGRIDTYSFVMKGDPARHTEFGVIAQELEKIFPDLVSTAQDEMGTKSVNYIGLIAPVIEASKELKAENEALRAELAALKAHSLETEKTLAGLSRQVEILNEVAGQRVGKASMSPFLVYGAGLLMGVLAALGCVLVVMRKRAA